MTFYDAIIIDDSVKSRHIGEGKAAGDRRKMHSYFSRTLKEAGLRQQLPD